MALTVIVFAAAAHVANADGESPPASPDAMLTTLESAMAGHRAELAELKERMAKLERRKQTASDELHTYDSQTATQQQLLMLSQLGIEELERAVRRNRASHRKLVDQLNTLQSHYEATTILFLQADEQIRLAEKQITELRRSPIPDAAKRELEQKIGELKRLLQEKAQLGNQYQKAYAELYGQLNKAIEENQAFDKTLSAQVESRLKRMLFTPSNPYRLIFGKAFTESLTAMQTRVGRLFLRSMWASQWERLQRIDAHRWVIFFFLIILIVRVRARSKRYLKRFEAEHQGFEWHFRCMVVFLLRRSVFYLGMTILFGVYTTVHLPLFSADMTRAVYMVFLMLLLTHWGLNYFKYRTIETPSPLRAFVSQRLIGLFRLARFLSISVILVYWIAGPENLLAWIARDVVGLVLLAWTARFWQRLKPFQLEQVRNDVAVYNPRKLGVIKWWSYAVLGIGLLVSVAGYSNLAGHWNGAWLRTVTIVFWAWVCLNAIREWQRAIVARQAAAGEEHALTSGYQIGWALLQLSRAIWLVAAIRGLIWAWDTAGVLMFRVWAFFEWTFTIGTLQFSIRGIFLAAAVIFFTHIAVHIGRALLDEKVLSGKELEPGLRDSIHTIATYLAWSLGLLIALASIGVNATSLAVVFGALSVGIGFGLQNIFNNFFSGLILLFERPIQVGDTVEVNGVWAEVKKINVRATVVQTFDNASVIIPNSEFVSQQVTNWSFKDKRMRRNLEIGVAYGSDIDLVESTLLDIAQNFQRVLKYPQPEVLFIDHGDSALIFRLRFWVHVDDYWAVPSRVRFEIDRRFRASNIEIAFPQRDIHVRTLPQQAAAPQPGNANKLPDTDQ